MESKYKWTLVFRYLRHADYTWHKWRNYRSVSAALRGLKTHIAQEKEGNPWEAEHRIVPFFEGGHLIHDEHERAVLGSTKEWLWDFINHKGLRDEAMEWLQEKKTGEIEEGLNFHYIRTLYAGKDGIKPNSAKS